MTEQLNPWVIVSSLGKDTSDQDLERIVPKIQSLVDNWQESGKIMWSGSFNNQPSSMAVFEATDEEAKRFYKEYSDACENLLVHYLYQWEAMPILSVLSN
ncbi:MAG: hypothetical protein OES14_03185 [Nitrosopumilus sp.]|nr:hypothetical protein [Nitrosopumilus sp.]